MLIAISLLVGVSVLFMMSGVAFIQGDKTVQERLDAYLANTSSEPVTLQELELSVPFSERVVMPLIKRSARVFAWMWPQNRLEGLRQRLQMAGNPSGISTADFIGVKGICTVFVLAVVIVILIITRVDLTFRTLLLVGGLGVCAFFLPDVWLSRQITRRQQELLNALPDALDMLTIVIEAGLSFENGLQEIVGKWKNELSREFVRVLREMGMGQSRRQALNGLSDRTGVPDIVSFVTALNQAEELGVSIGRVLRVQAEELRVRRRQRAQERANQAPVKMLFPLVFLIFPAIFAVILGPAVPKLIASLDR